MDVLVIATYLALYLHVLYRVIHSVATDYVAILSLANYSSFYVKSEETRCIQNIRI